MNRNGDLPPLLRKMVEQARLARSMGLLFGALSIFGIGGSKMKELSAQGKEIADQAAKLSALPSAFNKRFGPHGWLISESTSVEAAKKAIELFDVGDVDGATDVLCAQFEGDRLDFLFMRLNHIPEFKPRCELARTAATMSQAEQFTAAILLILVVVDGVATDAFGKSIFAEGVDVSEVKAIAGSADGFPRLVAEICRMRRKTNAEPIDFPFRNGIIHGKDVNFGNRTVAAKCWSLLSCLGDILRAKLTVEETEDERSLIEVLKDYQKTKVYSDRIAVWMPRAHVETAGDGTLDAQCFARDTPEHALCAFLCYWRSKNYGKLGELTVYYDMRPIGKRAGEIRRDLADVELRDARLLSIRDKAAAVTEVDCELDCLIANEPRREQIVFRLIYMDTELKPLLRGDPGGSWLVIPSYQGWALGARFM